MMRLIFAWLAVAVAASAADLSSEVTFSRDVLPILQKNCQTCHRPGQVAPMSLLTYKDARPWAKAMKAAVVARKMPPWFADQKYGHFVNDRSLKQSDIEKIRQVGRQRGRRRQSERRSARGAMAPGRLEHSAGSRHGSAAA